MQTTIEQPERMTEVTDSRTACDKAVASSDLLKTVSEKPILFCGWMVREILAGRKTQTRRLVKICDEPISKADSDACKRQKGIPTKATNVRNGYGYLKCDSPRGSATVSARVPWPYGYPGDRLWVKETHHLGCNGTVVHYRADWPADEDPFSEVECGEDCALVGEKWIPSIFMRRRHSRITLEIQSTGVERLNDISKADAIAEGMGSAADPLGEYMLLWEDINGKGSWKRNPWVWVVTFKQVFNK